MRSRSPSGRTETGWQHSSFKKESSFCEQKEAKKLHPLAPVSPERYGCQCVEVFWFFFFKKEPLAYFLVFFSSGATPAAAAGWPAAAPLAESVRTPTSRRCPGTTPANLWDDQQ
jgi:hypothetical protein